MASLQVVPDDELLERAYAYVARWIHGDRGDHQPRRCSDNVDILSMSVAIAIENRNQNIANCAGRHRVHGATDVLMS